MKRSSLDKERTQPIAENASGVFGRDLLKAGSGFRDVLMDAEDSGSEKVSRRSRKTISEEVSREEIKPPVEPRVRRSRDSGLESLADDKSWRRERNFQKSSPQAGEQKVAQRRLSARAPEAGRDATEKFKRGLAWKFGFKVFAGFLLVLAFVVAAVNWSKPITQFFEKPIKQVAVEGEFHYLSNARAMDLIYTQIDGHFLQLDLEKLKKGLESDPWIEHVYLNRRWPDTLVVKISEQKPIARWDQSGFVNQSGDLIQVKNLDPVMGLPWLKGDEANAREIMQQYQDLSTLFRSRNLDILGLECDSKKSWRIHLKNNIEIAVGRDQVMEKLDRFLVVYDKFLNTVWKDVETIDLRYTNGVSVRWLPESEMAKKYLKPETPVTKKSS